MRKKLEKYLSLLMAIVLTFSLVAPYLSLSAAAEDITADVTVAEQVPTEETVAPEAKEQTPTKETAAPKAEEQTSTEETVAPVEAEQAPAEETVAPAEEEQTPAEEAAAPVEAEQAPAEETVASEEEEQVFTEEAAAPAEEAELADAEEYTLTLDANGGSVDVATKTVTTGSAIGELPVPTRSGYYFLGWKDENDTTVTADTIYQLTADSKLIAQWVETPANPALGNTPDELFKFHCTSDESHVDQTYNWFGSYVKYRTGTLQYDEERGVFTAVAYVTSVQTLLSSGTKCPQKVWGHTHYHTDENGNKVTTADIQLVWDPTTQMWMPDGEQLVNVYCYSAPAAPTAAALLKSFSANLLWMRNSENVKEYLKQTKLLEGTFEIGEMTGNATDGFYCTVTITDFAPYIAKFTSKYTTTDYIADESLNADTTYSYTLKYNVGTSSVIDYKQDGTGWTIDYTGWSGQDKLNGKQLWLIPAYQVTFEDGADGAIFESTSETVGKGYATPVPGTEYEGYTFNGWSPELAETVTENVTYTASFTANQYHVAFNSNGGNDTIGKYLWATYGTAYGDLMDAGDVDGFTSEGWYVLGEDGSLGETAVSADTLVSTARDHVLFQKRSIAEPTVTISSEDDSWEQTYQPDTTFTMSADTTEYDGLSYSYQWYKDGTAIEGATSKTLTVDMVVGSTGTYKAEVTAAVKSRAAGIVTANTSATGSAEQTLTISKAENSYKLVYNSNESDGFIEGSVDGDTFTVELPSTTSITPWEGHTYTTTWTTNADGTGDSYTTGDTYSFDTTNVNGGESVTLYLQWELNQYEITLVPDNGEENSTVTVTYETKIEDVLPTLTKKGYTFVGWTDEEGNEVDLTATYTESFPDTLVANWEVNEEDTSENPSTSDGSSNNSSDKSSKDKSSKNKSSKSKSSKAKSSKSKSSDTKSPKTGDTTNLMLWVSLLAASAMAMCALLFVNVRKRKHQN